MQQLTILSQLSDNTAKRLGKLSVPVVPANTPRSSFGEVAKLSYHMCSSVVSPCDPYAG